MGPLSSLKIIEMVGLGPVPLAGQLLADLGAEVIVIDRKSGMNISKEVNRRGKKSIALNLKEQAGLDTALALIEKADVLMEGFRPGVMERLGLGPDKCHAINPKLIYGRMTGWGQEGPLSHSAGHDLNYLAITGMFLITGILSAIIERSISNKGQVIDAAMIDGVPAMMGMIQTMYAQGQWTANREDNFVDGGAPYYRCYTCADGKYLSVGCIEPQFFAKFINLLKLDETLLAKQDDKSAWPDLHQLFETTLAQKSRDEWAALFEGTDACVAPVLTFDEAETYPHNTSRNGFVRQGNVAQTNIAPRFSRSKTSIKSPSTKTGDDNTEVLKSIGITPEEITKLQAAKILC